MLNPGSPSHLLHPAGYPETVIREGSHLTEASWADGTQGAENSGLSLSPCSPTHHLHSPTQVANIMLGSISEPLIPWWRAEKGPGQLGRWSGLGSLSCPSCPPPTTLPPHTPNRKFVSSSSGSIDCSTFGDAASPREDKQCTRNRACPPVLHVHAEAETRADKG